jgi:hypothetical protein
MSAISFPSFYEKRLEPDPENRLRRVNTGGPLDGSGLRFVSVVHSGNRSESEEEAERISILVGPDTRAEIQSGALKLTSEFLPFSQSQLSGGNQLITSYCMLGLSVWHLTPIHPTKRAIEFHCRVRSE